MYWYFCDIRYQYYQYLNATDTFGHRGSVGHHWNINVWKLYDWNDKIYKTSFKMGLQLPRIPQPTSMWRCCPRNTWCGRTLWSLLEYDLCQVHASQVVLSYVASVCLRWSNAQHLRPRTCVIINTLRKDTTGCSLWVVKGEMLIKLIHGFHCGKQ